MTVTGGGPFRAAVTGLGMVTAAGPDTRSSWEGILAGRPTAAEAPELAGLPVSFACRADGFDGEAVLGRRQTWRLDRTTQLAMAATAEALAQAGLDPAEWDGARVGVVLGTALGGVTTWQREADRLRELGPDSVSPLLIPMSAVNMTAGHLAAAHGARGPNFATATACASGTTALGAARDLLRSNTCDIVVAGGTEAAISPLVAAAFAKMGALSKRSDDPAGASRPFDRHRDGFVLAEGAAVLVLERPEHAAARERFRTRISAATGRRPTPVTRPGRTPRAGAPRAPCARRWPTRVSARTTSTMSTRTARRRRSTTPSSRR